MAELSEGNSSLRDIAAVYKIPIGTLSHQRRKFHPKKPGHPKMLSEEEEKNIVDGILTMAQWGFPVDARCLRVIVKNYLKERSTGGPIMKNKLPGKDFFTHFCEEKVIDPAQRPQLFKEAS